MNCICGRDKGAISSRPFYEVTTEGQTRKSKLQMQIITCDCGVVRRDVGMGDAEIQEYYAQYQPTGKDYVGKTYAHDRELAAKRCDSYGFGLGGDLRILDVGSGSGAFVDECRARGYAAYGCEVADYAYAQNRDFIYKGDLLALNFPTDHFDRITCHDVLEHVIDPRAFVAELFRATKQGGVAVVDFPNFEAKAGAHHWKEEHLWYFTAEQLVKLLKQAGFDIADVSHPIESKTVVLCSKPAQTRTTILVPPGIGDSYWSIIKLQAFLKREKLGVPDVFVACNTERKHQGHKRAFPFLEMFPFLNATGESLSTESQKDVWKEAYAQEGRTIFKDVLGCDYFISYNGHLRVGAQMEELDPDLATNWTPPMFVSLEQQRFQADCQQRFGKYIVFYFIFQGTYTYWVKEFGIERLIDFIKQTVRQTGAKAVFAGARWDAEENVLNKLKREIPDCIDLVGKTNVAQLFGLLKGAELVVGYPSGLSIISTVLGAKTLILWNKFYNREFAWYACPPETRNKTYFIEDTEGLEVNPLVKMAADIVQKGAPTAKPRPVLAVSKSPQPNLRRPRQKRAAPVSTGFVRKSGTPAPAIKTSAQMLSGSAPLTVACVLKSGGCYTGQYVETMRNMVARNLTLPHRFVCLTDMGAMPGSEKLQHGMPGWWSKLELFRLEGPVLYFDLDTVIVGNLDRLGRAVMALPENTMQMLTPFNPKRRQDGEWASGVMAWHGDFRHLLEAAPTNLKDPFYAGWDQVYIFQSLLKHGVPISAVNDGAKIYSYKRHCRSGVPQDAEVVCFHGNARPHLARESWVQENWR
jgi:2-polyprenyl-3-methyl-5-hydroxy-6-metoxy-1,4-benzoquinol methylase